MSYESPTSDNNIVLRHLQGLRGDMLEMVERQARTIELVNPLALRVGELSSRMDKGFADVQSDIVLMENKVPSAPSDVMRVVRRLDDTTDEVEGSV